MITCNLIDGDLATQARDSDVCVVDVHLNNRSNQSKNIENALSEDSKNPFKSIPVNNTSSNKFKWNDGSNTPSFLKVQITNNKVEGEIYDALLHASKENPGKPIKIVLPPLGVFDMNIPLKDFDHLDDDEKEGVRSNIAESAKSTLKGIAEFKRNHSDANITISFALGNDANDERNKLFKETFIENAPKSMTILTPPQQVSPPSVIPSQQQAPPVMPKPQVIPSERPLPQKPQQQIVEPKFITTGKSCDFCVIRSHEKEKIRNYLNLSDADQKKFDDLGVDHKQLAWKGARKSYFMNIADKPGEDEKSLRNSYFQILMEAKKRWMINADLKVVLQPLGVHDGARELGAQDPRWATTARAFRQAEADFITLFPEHSEKMKINIIFENPASELTFNDAYHGYKPSTLDNGSQLLVREKGYIGYKLLGIDAVLEGSPAVSTTHFTPGFSNQRSNTTFSPARNKPAISGDSYETWIALMNKYSQEHDDQLGRDPITDFKDRLGELITITQFAATTNPMLNPMLAGIFKNIENMLLGLQALTKNRMCYTSRQYELNLNKIFNSLDNLIKDFKMRGQPELITGLEDQRNSLTGALDKALGSQITQLLREKNVVPFDGKKGAAMVKPTSSGDIVMTFKYNRKKALGGDKTELQKMRDQVADIVVINIHAIEIKPSKGTEKNPIKCNFKRPELGLAILLEYKKQAVLTGQTFIAKHGKNTVEISPSQKLNTGEEKLFTHYALKTPNLGSKDAGTILFKKELENTAPRNDHNGMIMDAMEKNLKEQVDSYKDRVKSNIQEISPPKRSSIRPV